MPVTVTREHRDMTAYLSGEIDHHGAREIMNALDREIDGALPLRLMLDLSGVTFMDSSGIGLILGRYRMMKGRGGALSVRCTSARQLLVMKMAGLEKLQILQQERTENHETDQ